MDLVWNIALQVQDQTVFKDSVTFIIRLHTKVLALLHKTMADTRCLAAIKEDEEGSERSA